MFEKLGRLFWKLGQVFKNLNRVFVLQQGPCCPNHPRWSTVFITSLMRWRWTKVLRWRHAPIMEVLTASGKTSKTSITTEHSCSSEMVAYLLQLSVLSETVIKFISTSFKRSYWNSQMKSNIFPRTVYIIESINFNCWNSKSWPPKSCVCWFGWWQKAWMI